MTKNGRRASEAMRIRAHTRWVREQEELKPHAYREEYRGHVIERGMEFYVTGEGRLWPVGYKTAQAARDAIDRCLQLREDMRQENTP